MLKVVDALPASNQVTAARAAERLLVEPDTDLLARRADTDDVPGTVTAAVRRAVLAGLRLRLHYAVPGQAPGWRTVDPVGLVTVRGRAYLLAARSGADRTYRLSRVLAAEVLDEPAQRPESVDLERAWLDRSARFRAGDAQVTVGVRVRAERRDELVGTALAAGGEVADADGWLRVEATFQDPRHAEWVVWQLGPDAEALSPPWFRTALHERASAVAARYRDHA
ncbi:helix-turn-helix transcriptional regulator [Cellulomonas cellasea]|uniref:Uncharacterized protein n=2 Tax=Cellulomonas cellasea TaxID=43670 RepID=A0A0A0B131_9CELL|nr:WYL domain-containing protein [Cellulomonas cellasea]KGM00495.1 hypothetical protein Q760_08395 [Cellulomonas cellasea DSM 20118]GEA86597.1 hypothetical protein CCE01nite_05460 [Cellulomonas cellasea]